MSKKKIVLLLVPVLFCVDLCAQSSLDSLISSLSKSPEDHFRVQKLNLIAKKLSELDTKRALEFSEQAISLAGYLNDRSGLSKAHIIAGWSYYRSGEYAKSFNASQTALEIAAEMVHDTLMAQAYTNIAAVYNAQQNWPSSLEYFEKSLALNQKIKNDTEVARALNNLGYTAFKAGDLKAASEFTEQGILISQAIKDNYKLAFALRNRGDILEAQKELPKAIGYWNRAVSEARAIGNHSFIASCQNRIGLAHLVSGNARQAVSAFESALKEVHGKGFLPDLADTYKNIKNAEFQAGNYRNAAQYADLYIETLNKIHKDEEESRIEEIQARFDMRQKEQEIRALQNENDLKESLIKNQHSLRNTLILMIAMAAGLLLLAVSRYRVKSRAERAMKEANLKLGELLQETSQERNKAEQANRLKSEFLAIAAHDLKNPLSAISGLTEMIETDFPPLAPQREITDQIRKSANRMHRLVADLLETAAIDSGHLELNRVNLKLEDAVTATAQSYISKVARKKQTLRVSCDQNLIVQGDKERLQEILDNLISNAVKYSEIGGEIQVSAHRTTENSIQIAVTDSGPGIQPDEMPKLFNRFTRLSARPTDGESSTGLGLSIVKTLVEMHDGRVWAEPGANGKGSSFIVELPAHAA